MKVDTGVKVKFALWGAVAGAVFTMILGFAWGGWSTSSTTEQLTSAAVLKSQAAICVAQFMTQPNHDARLAALKKVDSWKRGDVIGTGGWDKMPGQEKAAPEVAQACENQLMTIAKL